MIEQGVHLTWRVKRLDRRDGCTWTCSSLLHWARLMKRHRRPDSRSRKYIKLTERWDKALVLGGKVHKKVRWGLLFYKPHRYTNVTNEVATCIFYHRTTATRFTSFPTFTPMKRLLRKVWVDDILAQKWRLQLMSRTYWKGWCQI